MDNYLLSQKTKVSIWLYDNVDMRIEGRIIVRLCASIVYLPLISLLEDKLIMHLINRTIHIFYVLIPYSISALLRVYTDYIVLRDSTSL